MDEFDFIQKKPSQIRIRSKKIKHGTPVRCGGTWRRDYFFKMHKKVDRNVITKHVLMADGWEPKEIDDTFDFDDGGMLRYGLYKRLPRQYEGRRSIISRHPLENFSLNPSKEKRSNFVTYSLNKKKRWLLPDYLKKGIADEKANMDSEMKSDIDITVVEREFNFSENEPPLQPDFPDVISVHSTTLSDPDHIPNPRKRKSKPAKYKWSSDLLGPKEKSDSNMEPADLKPEIAYEICYSRTVGPFCTYRQHRYMDWNDDNRRQIRRKSKKRNRELTEDLSQNCPFTDKKSLDEIQICDAIPNYDKENPSIADWITYAEHGKKIHHRIRNKKVKFALSNVGKIGNKKNSKPQILVEKNKRNLIETIDADEHFKKLLKNEEDCSTKTKILVQSLYGLEADLCRGKKKNVALTIDGIAVSKSKSRPVKYAFQMENQIPVRLKNGEVVSALAYLILETLSNPAHCKNKHYCFQQPFCTCQEYLPVRVKVVILSDEERHQECLKSWKTKLEDILLRERPGCPGMYLNKVVKIAANIYNTTAAEQFYSSDDSKVDKKLKSLPKIPPYKRKVIDNVSGLLGFSYKMVDLSASLSKKSTKLVEEDQAIVNHTPRDFCEICWVELSEENGDYQATALSQCDHWFCYDCWRKFLTTIARGTATHSLLCPAYDCNAIVDEVTMMSLLPGNLIYEYQERQLKIAVNLSDNFYHCPQCGKPIQVANTSYPKLLKGAVPLFCICGARWCSRCKEEPHWPASCEEVEISKLELQNQRHSVIKFVSGRRCPKCNEKIEKNGGCQMMSCVCGYTFCWECMKSYEDCRYNCKWEENDLESWSLTSGDDIFVELLQVAVQLSQPYLSSKIREQRSKIISKTARMQIRKRENEKKFMDDYEIDELKYLQAKLEGVILHCDALRYIACYLAIHVGLRGKKRRNSPYPKMKRFLARLTLSLTNIEQTMLEIHNKSRMSLNQRLDKKMVSSFELLRFLVACVKK